MNLPLATTVRDGARALFHAITGRAPARANVERYRFALPAHLTGMGMLLAFEVELIADGGVPYRREWWNFMSPYPRLAFEHVSASASRYAKQSQLWIVGGSYFYSPERGLVSYRTPADVVRGHVEDADPTTRERYERTHGGIAPRELLYGQLRVDPGDALVPIARMLQVVYDADKSPEDRALTRKSGKKRPPWRHPFEPHAQPTLLVTGRGDQLIVAGGHYTVTPHGIEDRTP